MTASGSDHDACLEVAEDVGALLLAIREEVGLEDPAALRRAGDARAHERLLSTCRSRFPDDGFLSEEGADDRERITRHRVWIVDPLDGTREYSEGRDDWAVHVALVIDGVPAAGAVALPARGRTLSTRDPVGGAELGIGNDPPRMVVSRTRPAAEALSVAESLGAELVAMGSAGAKAMAVVLGDADLYLHSGGQYEWDSAAPVAVALAHGLHASRLDGRPLVYNQPNPWLPDLLICRPALAPRVLDALGAGGSATGDVPTSPGTARR